MKSRLKSRFFRRLLQFVGEVGPSSLFSITAEVGASRWYHVLQWQGWARAFLSHIQTHLSFSWSKAAEGVLQVWCQNGPAGWGFLPLFQMGVSLGYICVSLQSKDYIRLHQIYSDHCLEHRYHRQCLITGTDNKCLL